MYSIDLEYRRPLEFLQMLVERSDHRKGRDNFGTDVGKRDPRVCFVCVLVRLDELTSRDRFDLREIAILGVRVRSNIRHQLSSPNNIGGNRAAA